MPHLCSALFSQVDSQQGNRHQNQLVNLLDNPPDNRPDSQQASHQDSPPVIHPLNQQPNQRDQLDSLLGSQHLNLVDNHRDGHHHSRALNPQLGHQLQLVNPPGSRPGNRRAIPLARLVVPVTSPLPIPRLNPRSDHHHFHQVSPPVYHRQCRLANQAIQPVNHPDNQHLIQVVSPLDSRHLQLVNLAVVRPHSRQVGPVDDHQPNPVVNHLDDLLHSQHLTRQIQVDSLQGSRLHIQHASLLADQRHLVVNQLGNQHPNQPLNPLVNHLLNRQVDQHNRPDNHLVNQRRDHLPSPRDGQHLQLDSLVHSRHLVHHANLVVNHLHSRLDSQLGCHRHRLVNQLDSQQHNRQRCRRHNRHGSQVVSQAGSHLHNPLINLLVGRPHVLLASHPSSQPANQQASQPVSHRCSRQDNLLAAHRLLVVNQLPSRVILQANQQDSQQVSQRDSRQVNRHVHPANLHHSRHGSQQVSPPDNQHHNRPVNRRGSQPVSLPVNLPHSQHHSLLLNPLGSRPVDRPVSQVRSRPQSPLCNQQAIHHVLLGNLPVIHHVLLDCQHFSHRRNQLANQRVILQIPLANQLNNLHHNLPLSLQVGHPPSQLVNPLHSQQHSLLQIQQVNRHLNQVANLVVSRLHNHHGNRQVNPPGNHLASPARNQPDSQPRNQPGSQLRNQPGNQPHNQRLNRVVNPAVSHLHFHLPTQPHSHRVNLRRCQQILLASPPLIQHPQVANLLCSQHHNQVDNLLASQP